MTESNESTIVTEIAEIVREHLGDTYCVTRTWSAWQVGSHYRVDSATA